MSDEAETPLESAADIPPDQQAQHIAHEYARETKQWQTDEYYLEILSRDDMFVIDAVHLDDLKGSKSPNKSVQLHIHLSVGHVIRALAYQ